MLKKRMTCFHEFIHCKKMARVKPKSCKAEDKFKEQCL